MQTEVFFLHPVAHFIECQRVGKIYLHLQLVLIQVVETMHITEQRHKLNTVLGTSGASYYLQVFSGLTAGIFVV